MGKLLVRSFLVASLGWVVVDDVWGQVSTSLANVGADGLAPNAASHTPEISSDGRYVVFISGAPNLVEGDTNGERDVFVRDLTTGQVERVSVDSSGNEANDSSSLCTISSDGGVVVYESDATNLVPGVDSRYQIYVHDRATGQTSCASVDSSGLAGDRGSSWCAVSADGTVVAFHSDATNLVPGDTNEKSDVFVHERSTGLTSRVSVSSAGEQAIDDVYCAPRCLSGEGRYVAFSSEAANLAPNDSNAAGDVFVHDRLTGETTMVSVDSSENQGLERSDWGVLSSDGRTVAFWSDAGNLVPGDTNGSRDVFVRDLLLGLTERVSVRTGGGQASGSCCGQQIGISPDSRFVVFESYSSNLVDGDTNNDRDVFLRDRVEGSTIRVSVDSGGVEGNGDSNVSSVSADGRFVAFQSVATNLVAWDSNMNGDTFVHDRLGCSLPVLSYCSPSTTSIPGCEATLESSGSPTFADPTSFTVSSGGVPGGSNFGIAYFGVKGPNYVPFGSQGGSLCVHTPFHRATPKPSGGTPGNCDGSYDYDLEELIGRSNGKIVVGATVHVAMWFRDPQSADHFGLSDGLWFFVCP